jgi:hypothetical protein
LAVALVYPVPASAVVAALGAALQQERYCDLAREPLVAHSVLQAVCREALRSALTPREFSTALVSFVSYRDLLPEVVLLAIEIQHAEFGVKGIAAERKVTF